MVYFNDFEDFFPDFLRDFSGPFEVLHNNLFDFLDDFVFGDLDVLRRSRLVEGELVEDDTGGEVLSVLVFRISFLICCGDLTTSSAAVAKLQYRNIRIQFMFLMYMLKAQTGIL